MACSSGKFRSGIEDAWQIGYQLERLENDWVAVFLPQAPSPMSGNVMYLPANRTRPLAITMIQAVEIVRHIGVGSAKALQGTDLTLPAGTKKSVARAAGRVKFRMSAIGH